MMPLCRCNRRGFTLIEVLMVILLVGVLATVSILTLNSNMDESRFQATVAEMQSLRDALIGNTELQEGGFRSSFGFLGDIGGLPTNAQGLNALLVNPGLPLWAVNTAARFALGWNGPYITGGGIGTNYVQDGWGRNYTFNFGVNPATITSLGADGVAGGTEFNQDIVVQIPSTLLSATVHGFISSSGAPYTGTATVDMFYPVAGVLTSVTVNVVVADSGHFVFANIPFGRRSFTIYIPSKAAPTQTIGPVLFVVDKYNYVIPSDYTDRGGAGGGGGGGCSPKGYVTYVPGSSFLSNANKQLNFNINITTAVKLSSIVFSNPGAPTRTLSSITFDANTRTCTGLAPCPVADSTLATISPVISLVTGVNRASNLLFSGNPGSGNTVVVTLTHDLGCETLSIPVP